MDNTNTIANLTGYETPELMEIGDARELTLGWPNNPCADACECTRPCC
jgi:hypothetical protein